MVCAGTKSEQSDRGGGNEHKELSRHKLEEVPDTVPAAKKVIKFWCRYFPEPVEVTLGTAKIARGTYCFAFCVFNVYFTYLACLFASLEVPKTIAAAKQTSKYGSK